MTQLLLPPQDAATRFAALLTAQEPPPGFRGNCQIWQGADRFFQVDETATIGPRAFALGLRGVTLRAGQRVRINCGVAGCVTHVEPKEMR